MLNELIAKLEAEKSDGVLDWHRKSNEKLDLAIALVREHVPEPYLEYWVCLDDGECNHRAESGIGMVHDVDFQQACQMEDDLYKYAVDNFEAGPEGALSIVFTASGFGYNDGQMSFPETGQWDFPPHWEMDFRIKGYDVFKDGETVFVDYQPKGKSDE